MSRRLVVLRHAKSAYPDGVADHDRPLAPRGVDDAAAAGAWVRDHVETLDHVIVSSARRARETWALVEGVLAGAADAGGLAASVTVEPRVYDAWVETLLTVVRGIPEGVATALLVGHNPGCENLVTALAGEADPDAAARIATKYPTAAIAVLDLDGDWADVAPGVARLSAFVVPRG